MEVTRKVALLPSCTVRSGPSPISPAASVVSPPGRIALTVAGPLLAAMSPPPSSVQVTLIGSDPVSRLVAVREKGSAVAPVASPGSSSSQLLPV